MWNNRNKSDKISCLNTINEIVFLKNTMNKKKFEWKQPESHDIIITPYWLLGFIEGEGYFSISRKTYQISFGISQTKKEINVLKKIREFLLNLPGNYKLSRINSKIICLDMEKEGRRTSKPMCRITVSVKDYLYNVLIPLLDNLVWFSKKEKDYKDWKIILNLKKEGKHFLTEGQILIEYIYLRMNQRRLSSSSPTILPLNLNERIFTLLNAPSNYEIHKNGKIFIKSKGIYLKGIGTISIEVFNMIGIKVNTFNSRLECAKYFNLSDSTIGNRLNDGKPIYYNNNNFIVKRVVVLP
jgi:LAGLIDADG endonuclease